MRGVVGGPFECVCKERRVGGAQGVARDKALIPAIASHGRAQKLSISLNPEAPTLLF